MIRLHGVSRLGFFGVLGLLLALSACSAATITQSSLPTSLPNKPPLPLTPTLPAAKCDAKFGSTYQPTLPDASYAQTMVYAKVQLPPETRTRSDSASGHRYEFMCSAGTTAEVKSFLEASLMAQGWQKEGLSAGPYCDQSGPSYTQKQCWKDGSFELFVGLNSNADWYVAYLDPGALCNGSFGSAYQPTLPDASYSETMVYAKVQLPPQTLTWEDSAAGHRITHLCSLTTDDVVTFLQSHLTAQGWTEEPTSSCTMDAGFAKQRCWQNGKYALSLNLNNNLDWLLEYLDPAFV